MASNLNSEFNYRYQVIGSTPWEKLKTLKGFLVGRKRAAVLEQVADLKYTSYYCNKLLYIYFTEKVYIYDNWMEKKRKYAKD